MSKEMCRILDHIQPLALFSLFKRLTITLSYPNTCAHTKKRTAAAAAWRRLIQFQSVVLVCVSAYLWRLAFGLMD